MTGIIWISACTKTELNDLIEPSSEDLITYTENVRPIILNNCIVCHSDPPVNNAPMALTTYSKVKNAIENRGLLDRIQRQAGAPGAMPLGGPRLPQNLINIILRWKEDGFIE